jgi:hypothetical protein
MASIVGIHLKKAARYKHWKKIVPAWAALHSKFARTTGDAAYWYTERSNVGILAQAAWASGYVALEEYQVTKKSNAGEKEDWNGRCDLWITDEEFGEIIEAKQKYIHLASSRTTSVVNGHLGAARKDVRNTLSDSGDNGTALVFFPVYVPVASTDPLDFPALIDEMINSFKASDAEFIAWCFPEETRAHTGKGGVNYIPGLFIAAIAEH